MSVSRLKIAEVIGDKTLKEDIKDLALEVAAYLLSKGRVDELDSLVRDIIAYRADHGILEVTAISAHELTNNLNDDIKKLAKVFRPKSDKIIISDQLDPSLIGGVKLRLANQQLDLSIRAKLNKFKQMTNVGKA